MSKMVQIFEAKESVTPLIAESRKILKGKFAELDKFNDNGRTYPSAVYESAYAPLVPKIAARQLMGELDHPMSYDEVRLSNVSHVITECSINGKLVEGKVELLDTPAGKVAQALVEAGIPMGISSRGLGATKEVREGVEVTKLKLITFDLVAQPSFSDAILLKESAVQGLRSELASIEETLPLTESVETKSIRELISRINESVKVDETEVMDAVALLEDEIAATEDIETLRESVLSLNDKLTHKEGLLEARTEELRKQSQLIGQQQKIIENLKTVKTPKADPTQLTELVESVGTLTTELLDKDQKLKESHAILSDSKQRLEGVNSNMESLQENYNSVVEENAGLEEKLQESETLIQSHFDEIVELRKKLILESKGLSWKKYSPILEGCTTDLEMKEKLGSISHLSSGSSSRLNPEKVTRALTEGSDLSGRPSRLADIVSRI